MTARHPAWEVREVVSVLNSAELCMHDLLDRDALGRGHDLLQVALRLLASALGPLERDEVGPRALSLREAPEAPPPVQTSAHVGAAGVVAPPGGDVEALLQRLRVQLEHVEDGLSVTDDATAVLDAGYSLMTAKALLVELGQELGGVQ